MVLSLSFSNNFSKTIAGSSIYSCSRTCSSSFRAQRTQESSSRISYLQTYSSIRLTTIFASKYSTTNGRKNTIRYQKGKDNVTQNQDFLFSVEPRSCTGDNSSVAVLIKQRVHLRVGLIIAGCDLCLRGKQQEESFKRSREMLRPQL